MTLTESKSENSINNINDSNNSINAFTKNLKNCFMKLKSEKDKNDILKIIQKNSKKNSKLIPKRNSRPNISKIKRNSKTNFQSSPTPIEFYCEIQDFVKKEKEENILKIEKQKIEKNKEKENEKKKIEENKIRIKKKNKEKILIEKYENFWNKVKYYIDKKTQHLNKIKLELKMGNIEGNSQEKRNKSSILLYPKNKHSLYNYKNINEEYLNSKLYYFYKYGQKEKRDKSYNIYNNYINNVEDEKSENNFNGKYNDFYEKKLNWLKKRENKRELRKKYLDKKDKKIFKSFSFKPRLNKHSIKMINKRNKFLNFLENNPYTYNNLEKIIINKNDIYQKYLITIRPYMSFYYEKNSPYYKKFKTKFSTPEYKNRTINIGMIHINKGNNIRIIKEKNNSNNSIKKNRNIFNIFKPDKKNAINKKKEEKKNLKTKTKKLLWWNELNDINKKNNEPKKYSGLYKVNINENSSWNKICVNKIIPKTVGYRNLFNDLL